MFSYFSIVLLSINISYYFIYITLLSGIWFDFSECNFILYIYTYSLLTHLGGVSEGGKYRHEVVVRL